MNTYEINNEDDCEFDASDTFDVLDNGKIRLTDFKIYKDSEIYNINEVLDNKIKPLHDQKMGYAFIDKDYNLTDDMKKAERFIGIVGVLTANPILEQSYSSITLNAKHNKRIVTSGIKLDIPIKWLKTDIGYDGRDISSILKLRYSVDEDKLTYFCDCDHPTLSNSNSKPRELDDLNVKYFDLGRYYISKDIKGNSQCCLKINNFNIYPFDTYSPVIHKNEKKAKIAHLHT